MFRALLCPSSGAFLSLHTQPLFTCDVRFDVASRIIQVLTLKKSGSNRGTEAACTVKERLLMMGTTVPETC
jgi:hypothetical protein